MIKPKEIEPIMAEQIVFEDGQTLPKVVEALLERLNAQQGAEVNSVSEKGSETNGI